MTTEELLNRFQEKINQIYIDSSNNLKLISERNKDRYGHITNMYECDLDYYINVARYAWAERAKQIAMLEMQSLIIEIKTELNSVTPEYKNCYQNIEQAKRMFAMTDREKALDWYSSLSVNEMVKILKEYGVYGHDQGLTEDEVISIYKSIYEH